MHYHMVLLCLCAPMPHEEDLGYRSFAGIHFATTPAVEIVPSPARFIPLRRAATH